MSKVYSRPKRAQPLSARGLRDHPSLHQSAYKMLRDAILEGAYQPAERLYEAAIAEALGVSRNPVREAIRRLQQEGLVEVRPRSGVFVASLSLEEARDLYWIRAALEGVAAAFAAQRMTDADQAELRAILERMRPADGRADEDVAQAVHDFHAAVSAAAHSQPLSALLDQVFAHVSRAKSVAFAVDPVTAHAEHASLLDIIGRRDAGSSERFMREHVLNAYARLMKGLSGQDGRGPRQ